MIPSPVRTAACCTRFPLSLNVCVFRNVAFSRFARAGQFLLAVGKLFLQVMDLNLCTGR